MGASYSMGPECKGPQVRLQGLHYSTDVTTMDEVPAGTEEKQCFTELDVRLSGGRRTLVQIGHSTPSDPRQWLDAWSNGRPLAPTCIKYEAKHRKLTIFGDKPECASQLFDVKPMSTVQWQQAEKAVRAELASLKTYLKTQHWRGFDLAVVGKSVVANYPPQELMRLCAAVPASDLTAVHVALGTIELGKRCPTLLAMAKYFCEITVAPLAVVLGTIAREDKFVHDVKVRGGMGFFQWTRGEGADHPFGAAWTEATNHALFRLGAVGGGVVPTPHSELADLLAGAIRLGPEYERYVLGGGRTTDTAIAARRVFHMRARKRTQEFLRGDTSSLDALAKSEARRFPQWVHGITAGLAWLDDHASPQLGVK